VKDGFIDLANKPGLEVDDYNDEIVREHLDPRSLNLWVSIEEWDDERSHDRLWN